MSKRRSPYLQMALGVTSSHAGLLMVPMMGTMLVCSITVGRLVTRTGHYKAMPIVGSLLLALSLFLMSTISLTTMTWLICVYLGILGAGLGISIQILILIVHHGIDFTTSGQGQPSSNATLIVWPPFLRRILKDPRARDEKGAL